MLSHTPSSNEETLKKDAGAQKKKTLFIEKYAEFLK